MSHKSSQIHQFHEILYTVIRFFKNLGHTAAKQTLTTPIHFLIACQPELEIRDTFSSNILRSITHTLPLEHDYQSDEDIHHFLTSRFQELHSKRPHIPQSWPLRKDIDSLVKKSSGQLIYAATVIRYIESRRHQPEDRLQTILELKSSQTDTPFAALDALYLQIFSSVDDDDQIDNVLKVLTKLILLKNIFKDYHGLDRLSSLEEFFRYRYGQLEAVMGDMVALVDIPTKRSFFIKIHHASLPDFLLDPKNSSWIPHERMGIWLSNSCILIVGSGVRVSLVPKVQC